MMIIGIVIGTCVTVLMYEVPNVYRQWRHRS